MIVFDASTLILLAKIDMLEVFISNFRGKLLIPEKIKEEVFIRRQEETPLLRKLIENKKILVLKAKDAKLMKRLIEDFHIDTGEAEAIALALQENASLIATDDRNAIRACKMLKVEFTTAIAILIRAYEKKLIARDETLIKLQKLESFARYSQSIIEDAGKQIKGGI